IQKKVPIVENHNYPLVIFKSEAKEQRRPRSNAPRGDREYFSRTGSQANNGRPSGNAAGNRGTSSNGGNRSGGRTGYGDGKSARPDTRRKRQG
ncbi:MAG: hypothetical protein RSC76_04640, partial [Oscillospiraceae bacterium]